MTSADSDRLDVFESSGASSVILICRAVKDRVMLWLFALQPQAIQTLIIWQTKSLVLAVNITGNKV